MREIASVLGVSLATVYSDIKSCRDRWEREAAKNVFEIRSRELAKVDLMEGEAWAIFETAPDSDGKLSALDRVAKAIALRAKVYGLDRIQNLEAEREALQERTGQTIDQATKIMAKYLTPAQFAAVASEMNSMAIETEHTVYDALPLAPAAIYALPEPDETDNEVNNDE